MSVLRAGIHDTARQPWVGLTRAINTDPVRCELTRAMRAD